MRMLSRSPVNSADGRASSIDAVRAIAIFAVLAIHCDPFVSGEYAFGRIVLGDVVDLLARFAVPFFFITSGYFLGQKCSRSASRLSALGTFSIRLAGLVAFWYAFYVVWPPDWIKAFEQGWVRTAYWSAFDLFNSVGNFLAGPPAHLWFLMALLIGCVHVFVIALFGSPILVLLYFSCLYLIGLGQGVYGFIPELNEVLPKAPGTLTLSPLIIALGWRSATSADRVRREVGWALFIFGTVSTFVEAWMLLQAHNVPLQNHDFLLGTPFQALGLLYLVRGYPDWGSRTPLPKWGRYTLGVYAGHVAVMEVIGARESGSLVWELIKTPLLYALTLVAVAWAAQWTRARLFVT